MAQNRSTAVMQRRNEPHDSLDYFPTPPWATRALCHWLVEAGLQLDQMTVWEPACGEGHMALPLGEFFQHVYATDVHDYRYSFRGQAAVCDFSITWDHPQDIIEEGADWIITNPPFRLAEQFIRVALERARVGCAVLVRTSFLEGIERYKSLFSNLPPICVLQFVERVPMVKGRLDKSSSTATSYCWIIWRKAGANRTELAWLRPCRKKFERASDYPETDMDQSAQALPLLEQMRGGPVTP